MVNGFGLPEREKKEFEEYISRWIVVYPQGISKTFGGYCVKVENGYAILNPFQGGRVDLEKGLVRIMIEDDIGSKIPLVGSAIEPSDEESIRNLCEYANIESQKQRSNSSKEPNNSE